MTDNLLKTWNGVPATVTSDMTTWLSLNQIKVSGLTSTMNGATLIVILIYEVSN